MPGIYQISKDLGMVTAYAYAVSKGYTGTEDEFAQLMASYADVGQTAVDAALEATRQAGLAAESAADAASASETSATAKDASVAAKNEAVTARGSAVAAATTASEKAASANNFANAAANSANTANLKAEAAGNSAESASGSAATATSKANAAAQSATGAAQSAAEALTSKNAAHLSETNAQTSETNAAGSASAALASQTAAAASETNAHTSETNASGSAAVASEKATLATNKANEASQSATNAANSATAAAGSATNAAQSAQVAQDVLDSIPDDYTALVERVDDLDERKANIDGYYEQMTVGDAEQLVATVGVHDDDPYLFRTAGGSADIGNRATIEHLEGVTVAWNQLVQNGNFEDASLWGANGIDLSASDNVMTLTFRSATPSSAMSGNALNTIEGHKYLVTSQVKYSKSPSQSIFIGSGGYQGATVTINTLNAWVAANGIFQRATGGNDRITFYPRMSSGSGWVEGDTVQIKNLCVFDITQMFGSTIADYIYSLEQANAGAGVVFFRSIFPKDYYEYNPGQLMSVQAAKHITRGFNAWDEEWELGDINPADGSFVNATNRIRSKNLCNCVPGANYYIIDPTNGYNIRLFFYDASKNFISAPAWIKSRVYKFPDNARYFAFIVGSSYGTTYKNDICINLSWDGERDGEYEPYNENEYTLGEVELRGIPKLENGKIVYDGDTYESDGTVTRKYGLIDLGALTWSYNTTYNVFYTGGFGSLAKADGLCACTKYIRGSTGASNQDKVMQIGKSGWFVSYFVIKDTAYSDTETFKSSLSGVYLIYERDTSVTEQADPWSNPQEVDDFGTEEFVEFGDRDVHIPVGHSTLYQANLRAKLEMAPNSPDGDGDYVVRQTAGQNEYVPLTEATAEAMARKADIDGNYPDMTVGNAEQLVSTVGVDDNAPYNYRTSGGSADIGDRETLNAVVGGSLAWNQLVRDEASENTTDFADVVSVADATADSAAVEVAFEPVQDLHGYDHPWPGGGGKNVLVLDSVITTNASRKDQTDNAVTIYSSSETAAYRYVRYKIFNAAPYAGKTVTFSAKAEVVQGTSSPRIIARLYSADGTATVGSTIFELTGTSFTRTFTFSNAIEDGVILCLTFYSDSNEGGSHEIKYFDLQIEEGSTATSFAPYSNICPITGHTGVNVTRTGKNLVNVSDSENITTSTLSALYNQILQIKWEPLTQYALSISTKSNEQYGSAKVWYARFAYTDGTIDGYGTTVINRNTDETGGTLSRYTVVSQSGKTVSKIYFNQGTGYRVDAKDIMLEKASAATEYEAPQVATLPVSWETEAGTVYGGKLKVNEDGSGVLTVDRASVDLGTLTWRKTSDNIIFYSLSLNAENAVGNLLCSYYKYGGDAPSNNSAYNKGDCLICVYSGSDRRIYIRDDSLADYTTEQFEEAMLGVQCVYPLSTPITYTLTASQISTLLGENHVWSDAGQVSFTYTGTHEFLKLQNGRKYLTRIDGTDAMVAGTGQTLEAVKGTDNVFDLTQMFGSSVADVAYAQGPSWFRKYFPKALYGYNAGEIMNVKTSGHKMVGFNAFRIVEAVKGTYNAPVGSLITASTPSATYSGENPITVAIPAAWAAVTFISEPLVGGMQYQITATFAFTNPSGGKRCAYLIDDNYIVCQVLGVVGSMPTENYNLKFTTSKGGLRLAIYVSNGAANQTVTISNLCVHLVWDGERDGEYEPYEERTYPLDSSLELRGVPKLDASNNLYYDGDRYLPDGTVERRYGVVDLGTLDWSYGVSGMSVGSTSSLRNLIKSRNAICKNYTVVQSGSTASAISSAADKSILINVGGNTTGNFGVGDIIVKDSDYSTSAAFKAAMSGVYLIYELATPTTETAETYQETQIVDDFGTEEFIDERDIPIPVGHETTYMPNLRAKLEMVPDSPSDDGDYIVRHVNGQNEYIALPAMPSANGAYVLKVTVANGTPTLAWEAST